MGRRPFADARNAGRVSARRRRRAHPPARAERRCREANQPGVDSRRAGGRRRDGAGAAVAARGRPTVVGSAVAGPGGDCSNQSQGSAGERRRRVHHGGPESPDAGSRPGRGGRRACRRISSFTASPGCVARHAQSVGCPIGGVYHAAVANRRHRAGARRRGHLGRHGAEGMGRHDADSGRRSDGRGGSIRTRTWK